MNAAITPSVKGQISTEAQADIPESLQTLSSIVSAPCEIDVYLWSHLQKYYMEQGEDENLVYLGFFAFIATLLSLGLAIGVVIALGSLLFIQVTAGKHLLPFVAFSAFIVCICRIWD